MAGVNRELRMVFTDVDIFVIVEKKCIHILKHCLPFIDSQPSDNPYRMDYNKV